MSYNINDIIKYIVERLEPSITETIYDPCMNNGFFIIEYIRYITRINEWDQSGTANKTNLYELILHNINGYEVNNIKYNNIMNNIYIIPFQNNIKLYNTSYNININIKYNIIVTDLSNISYNFDIADILEHIISRMEDNGRCVIIIDNNILYDENNNTIRKKLLEKINIIKIISIAENKSILFFNNNSPTISIIYSNLCYNLNEYMPFFSEDILTVQDSNFIKEQDYIMIAETSLYMNLLTLSHVGILALDIIIKEYLNVSSLVSMEDYNLLLSNIIDYLHDRETYILSYVSKKAIDIIKSYYLNNGDELTIIGIVLLKKAIKNHINEVLQVTCENSTNKHRKHKLDNININTNKTVKRTKTT